MDKTTDKRWPDPLEPPDAGRIQQVLEAFWETLARLPDLLARDEQLLAAETLHTLRALVLELMLALNGIRPPAGSRHLIAYLSARQRTALERTLVAPRIENKSWIGQAVALVVIYRWYAPQLVERHRLDYPQAREAETWRALRDGIPGWPAQVTSE